MSTSAPQLLKIIQNHKLRIFTTSDVVTLTGMRTPAAAQALHRLSTGGLLVKIKRGLWVNRLLQDLNPYEAVPHLCAPWPAYVSLYSALSEYGVIEEIPQVIYAISASRPIRYSTPIGGFHIHHLPENLIWGYEIRKTGQGSYPIAEPEKAFLDLVYLALIPRSPLELPYKRSKRWNLNEKTLRKYALLFKFPPLIEYIKTL